MKEWGLVESNLENMRLFLLRSQEGKRFKESGNRFIRYMKALLLVVEARGARSSTFISEQLDELRTKITTDPSAIREKDWLIDKVMEAKG